MSEYSMFPMADEHGFIVPDVLGAEYQNIRPLETLSIDSLRSPLNDTPKFGGVKSTVTTNNFIVDPLLLEPTCDKCISCGTEFKNKTELDKHVCNTNVICTICDLRCINLEELKEHITNTHNNESTRSNKNRSKRRRSGGGSRRRKPAKGTRTSNRIRGKPYEVIVPLKKREKYFICKVCGLKTTKQLMIDHFFENHCEEDTDIKYTCEICRNVYDSVALYEEHCRTHPMCTLCDVQLKSIEALNKHNLTLHPTPNVTNNDGFDDDNFDYSDDEEDVEQQDQQDDTDNDKNDYIIINNDTIKDKLWRKEGLITFTCSICMKTFSKKRDLYRHCEELHSDVIVNRVIKVSAIKTGTLRCNICKALFSSHDLLMSHKFRHRGVIPYGCKWCCKLYSTQYALEYHYDRHHSVELSVLITEQEVLSIKRRQPCRYIKLQESDKKYKKPYIMVCAICKIRFKNRCALFKHYVKNHIERVDEENLKLKNTGDGEHKCGICGIGFKSKNVMQSHALRHFDLRPYMCKYCGRLFCTIYSCSLHQRSHHKVDTSSSYNKAVNKYQVCSCDICDYSSSNLIELRRHIKYFHLEIEQPIDIVMNDKDPYKKYDKQIAEDFYSLNNKLITYNCMYCNRRFYRKYLLEIHIQELHICNTDDSSVDKCSVCDICGDKFKHLYQLKEHQLLKHYPNLKPLKCPYCTESFFSYGSMYVHKRRNHRIQLRDEIEKNKMTSSRSTTIEYNTRSKNKSKFKCNFCNIEKKTKDGIDLHIRKVHLKVPYSCKACPTRFRTIRKYRTHICNTVKYPYVCTQCSQRFKEKPKLLIHRDIHKNNIECKFCRKVFVSEKAYLKHKAILHDRKDFLCPECGALFSTQLQLNRHLQHHKDMKHVCPECNRKFWDLRQLQQHRNMEHKMKRFICTICGRALSQKWHFEHHMRSHLGEKNFICEKCNKCYTSRNSLRYHYKTRHPELATATITPTTRRDNNPHSTHPHHHQQQNNTQYPPVIYPVSNPMYHPINNVNSLSNLHYYHQL